MIRTLAPVRIGLADQLAERLISAVARGEYPPDSRLPPEAELAEICEVSRLTLREAIKALRGKGVVRVEQGRGTFVNPRSQWSPLDPELLAARLANAADAAELAKKLTEARRLVEVGVAELAASRRSRSDITALGHALERMRRSHVRGDIEAFTAADIAFHDALMAAAGNVFVAALFEPIGALVRQVRRETSLFTEARENAMLQHAEILDAVAAGRPADARRAMDEHLRDTDQNLDRIISDGGVHLGPAPRRARRAGTR